MRAHFSGQIDPCLGSLEVRDFTVRDVERLTDRRRSAGLAPKTIRNVIGTLHGMLDLAVDRGLLAKNPCDMRSLPRAQPETTIRFLTPPELERVLAAAPPADAPQAERDWWPVLRLLVLTAAMTAMRLGELPGLRWRDLDMRALKVRVCQSFVRGKIGAPKSRASARAIPLASRLLTELDAHFRATPWNQDSDFVLAHPHTGRPLDEKRLMQRFRAALERADVRPIRIHDLRHTFATRVAASGQVSIRTLQEWMGHEHLSTTNIYAAYMPGHNEAQLRDGTFDGGQSGGQLVDNPANTAQREALGTPENAGRPD